MRLKDSDTPRDEGYFIRSALAEAERGPFTADNLADLVDCEQVNTSTLVRPSHEAEPRPLAEFPELMGRIFPEKKSFHFKSYQKSEDPDAGIAPVDVKELFRCDARSPAPPAPPGPPAPRPARLASREKESFTSGFASGMPPRESGALSSPPRRSATAAKAPRHPFSFQRTFAVTRWICAVILLGFAGTSFQAGITTGGILFLTMAVLLIALDLVGWAMDRILTPNAVGPPDYALAEEKESAGDWPAAVTEYLNVLEKHPYELKAYTAGIAAAAAADDRRRMATLQTLALEHLGARDKNLLAQFLHRRGLPPLPSSPPPSAR